MEKAISISPPKLGDAFQLKETAFFYSYSQQFYNGTILKWTWWMGPIKWERLVQRKRDKAVYYLFHKCHSPGSGCLLNLLPWGHLQIVGDTQKAACRYILWVFRSNEQIMILVRGLDLCMGLLKCSIAWHLSPKVHRGESIQNTSVWKIPEFICTLAFLSFF